MRWDVLVRIFRPYWLPLLLVACVVGMWAGSAWLINTYVFSEDLKNLSNQGARGVFGDQFGAINALFSGLAFTGVIATLIAQQKEINRQSATLMRQQFEHGFFKLLSLHTTVIDQLGIGAFSGRQAFERFLAEMQARSPYMHAFSISKHLDRTEVNTIAASGSLTEEQKSRLGAWGSDVEDILRDEKGKGYFAVYLDQDLIQHLRLIREAYIKAHTETKDALSHYFRTLYRVLRYVDESTLVSAEEKEHYIGLVGAQLSGMELAVIFYNALVSEVDLGGKKFEFGYPAMYELVTKYKLTRHLNADVLFHPIHMRVFYDVAREEK